MLLPIASQLTLVILSDRDDPQNRLRYKPDLPKPHLPTLDASEGGSFSTSFLLGFVFTPLWYYATFLYFGNYYHRDPRERAALLFPQSLSPGVCFSRILNTGDECKQCDGEPKRSKPSLKTITKFRAIGFAANRSSHVTTYDTLLKGPSIRKRLLRSHIDSYK
ncbi:hypothetical protein DY000_02055014 [Brassica cretica]|uniref:Uncharacterized protein n=1 Tax=Brassica cretica TaxID=69181 RepID=A0ABQ7AN51_BRACR|nr:hypothetical protein DY000_02055014 [Brassica cretica]